MKPYVVCHILQTIDGKISGRFFGEKECRNSQKLYGELRDVFQCDATLYGTATMEESYGSLSEIPETGEEYLFEDYTAETDVHNFIVAVDTEGSLQYQSKYLVRGGRPKAHVIELLTERVTGDYLTYLRNLDISYIFAGKDSLDLPLALEKLNKKFGIERLMLSGGGVVDQSFLQEGLIDEISLVITPLTEGNPGEVSLFEKSAFQRECAPTAFHLKDVQKMQGDTIWLRYIKK